jgi:hypothetical protein
MAGGRWAQETPKPRASGVEVGMAPIVYRPIPSKRFICAKCLQRLVEMTPVVRPGQAQEVAKMNAELKKIGKLPRMNVKLKCPGGCHETFGFSFHDIGDKNAWDARKFKPDPKAQRLDV